MMNKQDAAKHGQYWQQSLALRRQALTPPPPVVSGKLTRMVGLTLEAVGCVASIGDRCRIINKSGADVEAEVVGFAGERLYLMPSSPLHGLGQNARVVPVPGTGGVPVSSDLLGRVIDGRGEPLDGRPLPGASHWMPLAGSSINPLARPPIAEPLDVGVRAINALLTVGRGQRMGLFAGSGVGKSILLGMMTRFTGADVIVVGLIGERGREVKEFIEKSLGAEGLKRAVVVAAPADAPPLMRLHGAMTATAVAEYFRDQGKQVLLLMDSLTRFAQAQREIGLAIGEPPATKGYPPSVFARLPALVERAGNTANGGSITAFYTVLTEGDDHNDPIADAARAILDGHVVLSREIADAGRYPAIDIESSVSRALLEITDKPQQRAIQKFRRLHAAYESNRDLISLGAYQKGSDPLVDAALGKYADMESFLTQGIDDAVDFHSSVDELQALLPVAEDNS